MGKKYSQLSVDERNVIHRGRVEGKSFGSIARELNRPVSAVSREVARNTEGGSYDAIRAEVLRRRRRRQGTRKLAEGTALWHKVVRGLYSGWSPEQISGRLRKMHAEDRSQRVSHETIYLALYALPRGELRKELLAQLRQGHKTRRPRARGQDRRGGVCQNFCV